MSYKKAHAISTTTIFSPNGSLVLIRKHTIVINANTISIPNTDNQPLNSYNPHRLE